MKGKFWLGGRLGEAYEVMVGDPSAETLHLVLMNYFVTTAYGIGYWEFPSPVNGSLSGSEAAWAWGSCG